MQTRIVENKIFFLGNNDYETGILTIPAGTTIPIGALLKREQSGKFTPLEGEEIPVAVNPTELTNPTEGPADVPFRALITGRVRFDMLSVGGESITDEQADNLRSYGIIPKKVTDISWTE